MYSVCVQEALGRARGSGTLNLCGNVLSAPTIWKKKCWMRCWPDAVWRAPVCNNSNQRAREEDMRHCFCIWDGRVMISLCNEPPSDLRNGKDRRRGKQWGTGVWRGQRRWKNGNKAFEWGGVGWGSCSGAGCASPSSVFIPPFFQRSNIWKVK